ncbi:hypothetical protein NKY66_11080 [Sinorhizobium meliloti]|uniref:hypothetical protein n=1 Tax=Rhizobium meliloti TaxID=382 RepID=UPI003D653707
MENLINNTALTTLATEVQGKFAAILADLVEIETRTVEAYEAADTAWKADYNSAASYADRDFAYSVNDSIESVRRQVSSYQERVGKAVAGHNKAYAEIEYKRLTQLNVEAAKTADPIESGFVYLSAHINLNKGKPTDRATVLYMIEGTVYEAEVVSGDKGLFITSGWADEPSAKVHGEGKENHRKWFFWAEMTPEEIGKAVHLKEKIISAAWVQFNNLPRKRR